MTLLPPPSLSPSTSPAFSPAETLPARRRAAAAAASARPLAAPAVVAEPLEARRLMAAEYVSVTPDPTMSGNDASTDASVSGDGRVVAFTSRATDLVAGFVDGNGADGTDVFVRDVTTGVTALVSRSAAGAAAGANGASGHAAVSADGRFVAFDSAGTDLPAPGGDARTDVFLYEVATGAVTLVSRTPGGAAGDPGTPGNDASSAPSISGDGRFVAYQTLATNLGGGGPAIVVRDATAGASAAVSLWNDGSAIPLPASPSISDDGQRVAFTTSAVDPGGNQGPGAPDANGATDVYLRDLAAGATRLVSHTPGGAAGDGAADTPAVSGNGATVVFQSAATDLAGTDANGLMDVYAYDAGTGAVTLVSANPDGLPGDGESTAPSVSSDGRSVAFVSQAADLLPDSNNLTDVYVRDLSSGTTIVVGGDLDGSVTNGSALNPDLSADGLWVAFESIGTRLDPDTVESGDASDLDVFLTPRVAATPAPIVTPTAPGPDLTVVGSATAAGVEVANAGDVDAGPFVVRFALSADAAYDDADAELAAVDVAAGLVAGASVLVSTGDAPTPVGLPGGSYYVVARVDAAGAVAESVETNNDAASAAPEVVVEGPPAADTAANLSAGPLAVKLKSPSVVAGSKAPKASFPVTNAGSEPVDVTVAVRVAASADGTLDAGDTDVATFEDVRVKLKPGKTKVLKLNLGTFPTPPDGDYFLVAEVDSQNVLDESNEADNVGATASAVTIAAPFVDVRPTAASLGPVATTVAAGAKLTFKVPILNPGNVPLKATTEARLFASADAAPGADDVSLAVRPLKLSLKPGQTKTAKLTFALPDALPAGPFVLLLQLDATNVVVEANEADNVLAADNATTPA